MNKDLTHNEGMDDFFKNMKKHEPSESPIRMQRVEINKPSFSDNIGKPSQKNEGTTQNKGRPSSAMKKPTFGNTTGVMKKTTAVKPLEEDYEIVDRCHGLEKENLVLKEKGNLLEREIKKYIN